jgi:NADH-quinone oxidoreductase subunit E
MSTTATGRQISPEARAACEHETTRFPKKDGALLNILRIIEADLGYLDPPAVALAADFCGMPHSRAWGVFTFYSTFRTEKDGKYILWVCSTLPCALRGSDALYDHVRGLLELDSHGTTPDRLITLKKAECIGACGTAPCIQVNDDYYEGLTHQKAEKLVRDLQGGVKRPAGWTE